MQEKTRVVMIGTPTIDGKLNCYYVDSLKETILAGLSMNIKIVPIYIPYDALVQRARNDLFMMAHEANVDDLTFIDSDISWKVEDFFRLLSHKEHFIGGTVRKKTDLEEAYNVKIKDKNSFNINDNGLMEVAGIGTGFLRLDNYAIKKIWKNTKKYIENKKEKKAVFNVTIENETIISEDISLCNLWRKLKEKVFIDTAITCIHIGEKSYYGNFENFLNKIKENKQ